MSHEQAKIKNSRRRYSDEVQIKKQIEIAKANGYHDKFKFIDEPHRLVKHHALNCGNPKCYLCGNPRKTNKHKNKNKLTIQERRIFQNLDKETNKHSNGLKAED